MLRSISLICLSILLTATTGRADSAEPLIGTVTGTVVSESGSPVGGADVLILLDDRPDLVSLPKKLLAQGTTDAEGAFAVPVARSLIFNGKIHRCDEIQIWASHPEGGWTLQRSDGKLPDAEFSLTLNNPEPENLTVLAPDGSPASGIEVAVRAVRVGKEFIRVPEFLRNRFTATTDGQGRVELPVVSRDELLGAEFRSEQFGNQMLYWLADKQFSDEVRLRSIASVRGRVEGALPAGRSYEELSISFSTKPIVRDYDLPTQLGTAEVRVQPDGTFTVPRLATGLLEIEVEFPDDLPAFALSPEGLYVSENSTARVTIPLQHAKRITGRAIDAETKQPIPDVRVFLPYGKCRPTRTDALGKFVLFCAPSSDYRILYRQPESYHAPQLWERTEISIPPDATGVELAPLELIRGETLTGTVKDSKGNAVSGIQITAYWDDRLSSERRQLRTVSDDRGQFEFQSVNPHAPLGVRALVERISVSPRIWKKLNEISQPIEFTVDRDDRVSLTGKIVDEAGQPVPNAEYQISVMLDEEYFSHYEVVGTGLKLADRYPTRTWEKAHSGRTDAAGEFQTPQQSLAAGTYHLYPMVDGTSVGHSGPLNPQQSGTARFDDVVQKLKQRSLFPKKPKYNAPSRVSFSALVTNQQGEPIPDAKVVFWTFRKRLQLRTDESGRFHLPNVYKKGVWVFIDAEGYRFFGEFVQPAGVLHRITLIRTDEPAGEPMRTITDTVDEDVLAKARQEFMEFMEHCHELGSRRHKHELMGLIPQLDPEMGMNCLEDPRFDASDMNRVSSRELHRNRVRYRAAMQYLKYDIRKAMEAARSMTLGTFRVSTLCRVAGKLPAGEQQFRNELLSDALSTARAIENPLERFQGLAVVAANLIELGQTKRGQIVLHEAIRLAEKPLPDDLEEHLVERANYYRAYLARNLAPFDLPAALELIPEADENYTLGRYYGGLAGSIAEQNPAEAERVFERVPAGSQRTWVVRVCYRMAKVDYDRARQLSETIGDPRLRSYSWGVMAHAIAEEEPQKARELLDEAFDALGELVASGQRGGSSICTPLKTAVCLLPVVEQVDPDRLREYFWRALSFRQNSNTGKEMTGLDYLGTDPVLGAFLVRYDRKVAEILIRPDYEWLSPNVDEWDYFLFGGLAAIDPAEAVHLVSQLPEKTDYDRDLKLEAWNEIVPLLVNRGKDGWNDLKDDEFLFREIDDLDL